MSDFTIVIRTREENEKVIILDSVDDTNISGNVSLTTQPMMNGDEISDHIFRHGKSMDISGSFSLNGSKGTFINNLTPNLKQFQAEFERLSNEGILCDIYKISTINEKDVRFLQRTNMILERFSWTEKINMLTFNFSFRQVLLADIVELNVDTTDVYLPSLANVDVTSLRNELINREDVIKLTNAILKAYNLIDDNFLSAVSSFLLYNQGKEVGIGLATTAIGIGVGALALLAVPGFGLLAGIAITGIGVLTITNGIKNTIDKLEDKQKYLIKPFKVYENNENATKEEIKRFETLIDNIINEVDDILDKIKIYGISENKAQTSSVLIGNEFYDFTFGWNNLELSWNLTLSNMKDVVIKQLPTIKGSPTHLGELNSENCLFKTEDGYYIYIIYNETTDSKKDDLTNYYVVVCEFNADTYNEQMTNIIKRYILK